MVEEATKAMVYGLLAGLAGGADGAVFSSYCRAFGLNPEPTLYYRVMKVMIPRSESAARKEKRRFWGV